MAVSVISVSHARQRGIDAVVERVEFAVHPKLNRTEVIILKE